MAHVARRAVVLVGAFLVLLPALATAAWRSEGPFVGGIVDLAVDPADARVVYAATDGGGVWRSDDGGASWKLPGAGMTSRDVGWVAADPGKPGRVWAGVGRNQDSIGLWRSDDRGATWKPVQDRTTGGVGRMSTIGQHIAFVPAKPTTLFVPASNLHYRSDDGGRTWHDFRVPNQDAYVFAAHPTNPLVVLAGGRGDSLNVSRSTDGGKTWRQTGIGLGQQSVSRLFYDPRDPKVVYVLAGTFGKVFRSTDGGDSFGEVPLPSGSTSKVMDILLGPDRRLWAPSEEGLFYSEDQGGHWKRAAGSAGGYLVRTLAFDGAQPRRLLAGTMGGGVFRSDDGGTSWQPSSQGLAAGFVKKLWAGDRASTVFTLIAGTLYRMDAPGQWAAIEEPFANDEGVVDIDGVAFDRASPQGVWVHDGGRLWHSSDGGRRWQQQEIKGPSMMSMMKGNVDSPSFTSFAQDAANPKQLWAGGSSSSPGDEVWSSSDGGKKWKPVGNGLPDDKAVRHLVHTGGGGLLAVVDKELYRTSDGGGHWSAAASGLPDVELRQVAFDAKHGRVLVATEKGLYRSADGGASFTKVGGKLAERDFEAVVADPASGTLYAGCFDGLYASSDGGETWTSRKEGLADTDVRALAVGGNPARLWVGLAGGSVMSTELP